MRLLRSILMTALLLLPLAALAGGEAWWVLFTDRGEAEALAGEALLEAAREAGLREEALERRRLEGIPEQRLATHADLPPDPAYQEAVAATGADLRRTSRWFNRVSVTATPSQREAIRELPFVLGLEPVAAMTVARAEYEVVETWDGNPPPGPGLDAPGSYGPSYLQALQVNAVEAHRRGITGRGVLLAVLDSGFQLDHEAFAQVDVAAQWDVIFNDGVTADEEEDRRGQAAHGTGVLSEIGGYSPGNLIGIAYEADFILAKTEDTRSEGPVEEDYYVAALEWAERLGARVTTASLSYQGWYNPALKDGRYPITSRAIERARELGVVSCNSAANDGPQPRTIGPPADAYSCVTVGAVDSLHRIAGFSSRGPTSDGRIKPDLVARGVRTVLAQPYTSRQYGLWNGTSMSTPIVAGVVALVRSARPGWSADRTVRALRTTADRAAHPDNAYGWGTPDVMAAIRYPELRIAALNEAGEPVEGVRVRLTEAEQKEGTFREASSGREGVVSLANLPEGDYRVEILAPEGWSVAGSADREVTIRDGVRDRITLRRVEDDDNGMREQAGDNP